MSRSPVNRRDPTGTKRIEREEIARQREVIRAYGDAMARVATGDDPRRTEILERLKNELGADLESEVDEWMARTEQATVENTDRIMNDSFWIGVYPGMTQPMLEAMVNTIKEFVKQY